MKFTLYYYEPFMYNKVTICFFFDLYRLMAPIVCLIAVVPAAFRIFYTKLIRRKKK